MSHFNLVAIVNLLESKATYGSGLNDKLITGNDLANLMTLKFMSFIHYRQASIVHGSFILRSYISII